MSNKRSFFKILLFTLMLPLLSGGCLRQAQSAYPALEAAVDSVRRKYAPDSRDEVYEIAVRYKNGRPVLRGCTSVPEARAELAELALTENPAAIDSIVLLPDETAGDRIYGVINVSVADLRTSGDYAAEMATQLLLGMPALVLQHNGWWRVKTPEGYVAWVEDRQLVRMNREAFEKWTKSRKAIFTGDYGFAVEKPDETSPRVSDLVYGDLLQWEGDEGAFRRVSYPDGRKACIPKAQSCLLDDGLTFPPLNEAGIVREAMALKGIPYTWGGTSVKGMDCSGFVKTVFLKHGVVLRRDASQQALTGIPVDISRGLDSLRAGDLLFFGKKAAEGRKERIRHVGIYLGNWEFIHALGYVRVNSLNPAHPNYDRGNAEEFVRASRIVGAVGTEGVWRLTERISSIMN